jgi:hypothetical protein
VNQRLVDDWIVFAATTVGAAEETSSSSQNDGTYTITRSNEINNFTGGGYVGGKSV